MNKPGFHLFRDADGSIFVGATSQNPTPATNAEFLVLTFKPLKTAPAAELSINVRVNCG